MTAKQMTLGRIADALESRLANGVLEDEDRVLLNRLWGHLARAAQERSAQYQDGRRQGYEAGFDYGLQQGYEEAKQFNSYHPGDPLK